MFGKLQQIKEKIEEEWDDFLWRNGPERKLLAKGRLEAHRLAMEEGRNSPYTHPEEYSNFY